MGRKDRQNNKNSRESHIENVWQDSSASCLLGFFIPGRCLLLQSTPRASGNLAPSVVACGVSEIFGNPVLKRDAE